MRNNPYFYSEIINNKVNNENISRFENNNVIRNFYDNKIQNQKKIYVLNENNDIEIINIFFFLLYVFHFLFFDKNY